MIKSLALCAALVGCAPHHIRTKGTEPPAWKYAADFTAMAVGGWVGMNAQFGPPSDTRDAEMALGYGTALMIFIPYWLVDYR